MAEEFDDDLDLSTLNDEDLTEQVHDDLYNGLREEVVEATEILLSRGWSADRVLNEALVEVQLQCLRKIENTQSTQVLLFGGSSTYCAGAFWSLQDLLYFSNDIYFLSHRHEPHNLQENEGNEPPEIAIDCIVCIPESICRQ